MKRIKWLLVVWASLFLIQGCYIVDPCDSCHQDSEARETFELNIDGANRNHLELCGINGSITITGEAGREDVRVWGEKVVRSFSEADAEAHLDVLEIDIAHYGSRVKIETDQPRNDQQRSYEIEYHVLLPTQWKVAVDHVNGDVLIDSLNNDVGVDLVNGGVFLFDIFGQVDTDLTNGGITCRMTLPEAGTCRLATVNGGVALSIPTTTSAGFSASVANGTISMNNLEMANMQSSQRSMSGTLGDGNGTIRLSAVNGGISVAGY